MIIPNKDLITGRLLNWTLSDSTNRIVINVGVAYALTRDSLVTCWRRFVNRTRISRVIPRPVIAFEEFANSTLKLTIRAFLNSLDVRLPTIHDLHTQIHEEFQREGISIAFPQQDIHIRSMPQVGKCIVTAI